METYSFLRELADSWVLLLMTIFFLGTIVWAFRPGSRDLHRDTANIPFRNDTPAPDDRGSDAPPACTQDCASCACKALIFEKEPSA